MEVSIPARRALPLFKCLRPVLHKPYRNDRRHFTITTRRCQISSMEEQLPAVDPLPPLSRLPKWILLRSWILTSIMASPILRKPALYMLGRATSSGSFFLNPKNNPIARYVLTKTVYDHFCAGRTIEEVKSAVASMKQIGYRGIILGNGKDVVLKPNTEKGVAVREYSAQDFADVERWKHDSLETLSCIGEGDILGLKFTAAGAIAVDALRDNKPIPAAISDTVDVICQETKKQGSRLWFDAEQQILQRTLDEWVLGLMRKHNTDGQALVSNTIQAYLKGARANAQRHTELAAKEGWTLGVKLVRGAYIDNEVRSLIHDTKEETDSSYNEIALNFIDQKMPSGIEHKFPDMQLFVATHNIGSIRTILPAHRERIENGQPTVRLECGQLQGMADEVSCELLQESAKTGETDKALAEMKAPRAFKCLCWGSLEECLAFLYRRSVENRDAVERTEQMARALGQEILRRLMPLSRP